MSLLLALLSAGGYTVTADAGAYTVGGVAASLSRSYRIAAEPGAYSVSGVSAALLRSKVVAGDSGAYSYTGQAAGISYSGESQTVGRRFKHYSKGYLKRGNEVLVFPSEQEAEEYEAAEIAAKQAISRAQKKKARAEKPKPIETVNLARVERQAIEWKVPDYVPSLIASMDFENIVELQRRIELMQDDEEIELLLTL